jgi:transposase
MLNLALPGRIFVCTQPADMRKSFDGLAALVGAHLGCDPLSGDLYVFRSKRGDRIKLLYWNDDGYALWYRRLEKGTFPWPIQDDSHAQIGQYGVTLRPAELAMLLDGIELTGTRRRPRYQRTAAAEK